MKWNKIDGNFIVAANNENVFFLDMGITHNEWNEFLTNIENIQNKRPDQFIVHLQYECAVGEILNLEINNNTRMKVKVIEIIDGGEKTYLLTSNF